MSIVKLHTLHQIIENVDFQRVWCGVDFLFPSTLFPFNSTPLHQFQIPQFLTTPWLPATPKFGSPNPNIHTKTNSTYQTSRFSPKCQKVGCLNSAKKRPFYNVRLLKHTSLDLKTAYIRLLWCRHHHQTLDLKLKKLHISTAFSFSGADYTAQFPTTGSSIAVANLRKMIHRALILDLCPRTMYWGNLAESFAKLIPKLFGLAAIVRKTFPQLG